MLNNILLRVITTMIGIVDVILFFLIWFIIYQNSPDLTKGVQK